MVTINLFILFGLGFGGLAALCAFVITYEEWSHHYASNSEPLKHALKAAIAAFIVFMLLMVLAGIVIAQLI